MNYKKLAKVSDSATVTYKVFYPVQGKKDLAVETFEGTEEEAKAAADDFAANFPREKVIIHKVSDSAFSEIDEVVESIPDSNGNVVKVHNETEAYKSLCYWNIIDVSDWSDESMSAEEFLERFEMFNLDEWPEPLRLERNGNLAWLEEDKDYHDVEDSRLSFLQRAELSKMIKDAFSPGDIYNDGNVAGKVARVENDYVVVETQNEEGDVQNVEVPIEDFLDFNAGINGDIDVELPAKPEEQFEEPNPSDIVDSIEDEDEVDIHRAAIDILTAQNIIDIYDNGFTIIDVPSEVDDLDEFAKECAAEAQNMADQALGSEDKGAPEILSAVEDGQIVLYVA